MDWVCVTLSTLLLAKVYGQLTFLKYALKEEKTL
jgi:hypothetical protein